MSTNILCNAHAGTQTGEASLAVQDSPDTHGSQYVDAHASAHYTWGLGGTWIAKSPVLIEVTIDHHLSEENVRFLRRVMRFITQTDHYVHQNWSRAHVELPCR